MVLGDADDLLRWFRFYTVHQLLQLHSAGLANPINALQALLVTAAAYLGASSLLCLSLAVRVSSTVYRIPFVWDSFYWCLQTDSALLLALLGVLVLPRGGKRGEVLAQAADTARWQLCFFYFASAFWKLNTSFLDPQYSCAPVFFMQLLGSYGPVAAASSPALLQLLADASPVVTVAGEMAIAVLFARRGLPHHLGVLLAILLHGGIAIVPPPNDAVAFSVSALTRVLITLPVGTAGVHDELVALFSAQHDGEAGRRVAGVTTAASAFATAAAVAAAVLARTRCHPSFADAAVNPCVVAFGALAMFAGRAVALERRAIKAPATTASRPPAHIIAVRFFFVAVAFAYALVLPVLGLQDLGSCNMYSNLRSHGGSNHLLLPTGVLQTALRDAPNGQPLGGGVVRVEETNSTTFRSLYPAELTAHFLPEEVRLLRAVGHSGRMFNGGKPRVLGLHTIPPVAEGAATARYTISALELRRLLKDARAANESFMLKYSRLPGARGDEAWRINASDGPAIVLHEDGRGGQICMAGGQRCAPDELALLPPPSPWALKLILGQPYPILSPEYGQRQLHCFGP